MFAARRGLYNRRISSIARHCSKEAANMEKRDYAAAIAALNTLQSNFAIVDAIRKSGKGMNQQAIPEMIEWCRKIGYEPSEFDRLKLIHIAGTKGKGSTSAFVSSILAQYLPSTSIQLAPTKIGLYTSPHLRHVRERIQIDNVPISEDMFTKYFFEVWDRLEAAATTTKAEPNVPAKPVYFRYLTLMALHTYLQEGVDSAIIECGIGGEYDSTNIIEKPTVTAVTSLGIDHTAMLGSTLPEIAWHKAGIFKPNSIAFSAPQKEEAVKVLQERAAVKGTTLRVVEVHPDLLSDKVKLGLSASFQKINASVAIAVAAAHLRALGHTAIPDPTSSPHIPLPQEFIRGLERVHWPGRCEIRRENSIAWHIDGGHTLESIEVTGCWFAEQIQKSSNASPRRILIFNQQTRDANALAKGLHEALLLGVKSQTNTSSLNVFSHVIFCTNQTFSSGYKPDLVSINTNKDDVDALSVQRELAKTWNSIEPSTSYSIVGSIEDAVKEARQKAKEWTSNSKDAEVMTLVTGSLHLVGGFIEVLETG